MSLHLVVQHLNQAKRESERELSTINQALGILGKKPVQGTSQRRVLSASARRKIAAAQRLRWAKVRKANKKAAA